MALLTPFDSIVSKLKENDIVPDVIPDSFTPTALLNIRYPSSGQEVDLGNFIKPAEAKDEPEISFLGTPDESSSYTLVMTDPDAPSRKDRKFGQWRHWVLPGLKPASDAQFEQAALNQLHAVATSVPTLEAATPYVGPGPGPGTGVHRYTFLLFREPNGYSLTIDDVGGGHTKEERRHWNAFKFAETKDLTLVAANFFLVQA